LYPVVDSFTSVKYVS